MNAFFHLFFALFFLGSIGSAQAEVSKSTHSKAEAHSNHTHQKNCGHPSKKHGDHEDFDHDGHQHRTHGDHYDECTPNKTTPQSR
jgi:hypothetical protein